MSLKLSKKADDVIKQLIDLSPNTDLTIEHIKEYCWHREDALHSEFDRRRLGDVLIKLLVNAPASKCRTP